MTPVVAILATLDTKSAEAEFLRAELVAHGCSARLVDVGLRSSAFPLGPGDVSAETVAEAGGSTLADFEWRVRRDQAVRAMADGAARILGRWCADGEVDGVLAVGGNQGTHLATAAMRELPFGLPKYVVSTVASSATGLAGDSDIVIAFSVGDLLGGPNPVTGPVLRQAAAAMAGMARDARPTVAGRTRPLVAVTCFGNTHRAVTAAIRGLTEAGIDTVPFHASGASGSAMERFVDEGMFDGVLDLTTHEVLAEIFPADIYAPVRPGRLTAAGRRGLPQVVSTGGLEYHCFDEPETIPAHMRDRPVHFHNPNNTNVRSSGPELVEVAKIMAERLSGSTGPVTVLVPTLGWSEVGSPGGTLHDPEANAAFVAELRRHAGPGVEVREIPATINDPSFAAEAVGSLCRLLDAPTPATGVRQFR